VKNEQTQLSPSDKETRQPEKFDRMGPSPIVKFEVSTVEMLQNTKTADGFSRPQVVCWCGAIRRQGYKI